MRLTVVRLFKCYVGGKVVPTASDENNHALVILSSLSTMFRKYPIQPDPLINGS